MNWKYPQNILRILRFLKIETFESVLYSGACKKFCFYDIYSPTLCEIWVVRSGHYVTLMSEHFWVSEKLS
jgi:hypothetical protein